MFESGPQVVAMMNTEGRSAYPHTSQYNFDNSRISWASNQPLRLVRWYIALTMDNMMANPAMSSMASIRAQEHRRVTFDDNMNKTPRLRRTYTTVAMQRSSHRPQCSTRWPSRWCKGRARRHQPTIAINFATPNTSNCTVTTRPIRLMGIRVCHYYRIGCCAIGTSVQDALRTSKSYPIDGPGYSDQGYCIPSIVRQSRRTYAEDWFPSVVGYSDLTMHLLLAGVQI